MLIASCISFLRYLKYVKRYSDHTIRNYSIDIDGYIIFLKSVYNINNFHGKLYSMIESQSSNCISIANDIDIGLLSKDNIRGFMAHMFEIGKCRRTILRRVAAIKSLCSFMISDNLIEHNPSENIDTPKKPSSVFSVLDKEVIFNFFEQPDLSTFKGFRDRCIMELLYCTGMRVSELAAINIEDINFEEKTIKVKGKGKQERLVFFTECVAEWLKAYIEHKTRKDIIVDKSVVFLNRFGTRINIRSIDRAFKIYVAKSGIACNITPHSLRRALACHYIEKGIDIKSIKNILGHTALSSTTVYARSTSATRMSEYRRAHPRS